MMSGAPDRKGEKCDDRTEVEVESCVVLTDKRGRKRRNLDQLVNNSKSLRSISDVREETQSKSTKYNMRRMEHQLRQFAAKYNLPDPENVTPKSSNLVVTILELVCNTRSPTRVIVIRSPYLHWMAQRKDCAILTLSMVMRRNGLYWGTARLPVIR